jgi:hypothetical protein
MTISKIREDEGRRNVIENDAKVRLGGTFLDFA